MKQCDKCGHLNDDSQAFCGQCGNNLNIRPVSTQTAQEFMEQRQNEPLPQPPKKKKKWWIIIIVILAIFIFFWAIGSSDDTEPTNNNNNSSSSANNITENNDNSIDGEYDLELIKSDVVKDSDGKKVLVVTYNFKNLTEDSTNFNYSLDAKAFDDGIELDTPISMWGIDGYDFHNNDLDIKSGKSIQVQKAYYLRDNTKEVEIEISKWASFSDKVYKTFKITID